MLASLRVSCEWLGIACAAIAASGLGCGGDADRGDPPALAVAAAQDSSDGCSVHASQGGWLNQPFSEQTGRFHAELDVTPSSTTLDALVGLSDGSASSFSQVAAIVRFNASGTIDARDGSGYRADVAYSYVAGLQYHVRFDVDVRTHTYSAWLRIGDSPYLEIARSYSFRTEQAAVGALDNLASELDSESGTFDVCAVSVVADATTADGCLVASAADGVVSAPLPDATVVDAVQFTVQSSAPNVDAVIGLSAGAATGFSDLAAALRLSPAGVLDARDGDVYRADVSQTYDTRIRTARLIADVTSHTYSVFVSNFDSVELARGYRFRTQQRGVAHLDHANIIVDGTPGTVQVCALHGAASSGVAYSREGRFSVVPLGDDSALLSDGVSTTRVAADGHVIDGVTRGGELAIDGDGNVFIASLTGGTTGGTTLAVNKYGPGFVALWSAAATVLDGSTIAAMTTDADGDVLVGTVAPGPSVSVSRFTAAGALATQLNAPGEAVTIDGDQPIIAWNDGATLRITRNAATGATVWQRSFAGNARITAMTTDPGHAVVFGGELLSAIDFGGGTLRTESNDNAGPINGFVVKLSSTGAHVFSTRTGYSEVGGIAASASVVLVSSTEHTQFRYEHLQAYGPSGGATSVPAFSHGLGEQGFGRRVFLGPTGRIYWNLDTQFPAFHSWPYLIVVRE